MRFLFPLLFFLLIFYIIRSILQGFIEGTRASTSKQESGKSGVKMGRMEKDPVCGMYVDVATSVVATFEGMPKYFCSTECLNKYKKAV
jgi:YHS domain-containing protein